VVVIRVIGARIECNSLTFSDSDVCEQIKHWWLDGAINRDDGEVDWIIAVNGIARVVLTPDEVAIGVVVRETVYA
jgi:hypothetical protein